MSKLFIDIKIKVGQYVERNKPVDNTRTGECKQCHHCCKLVFRCPYLIEDAGGTRCKIYNKRPNQCRKSPRTKKYIKWEGCGYKFK